MATTNNKDTKTRRDNGDGSIKQRKDGRWEAQIYIDGIRKSLYGKSETEVKRKLRDYRKLKAKGYNEVKKIKFNEYLNNWLLTYKLGVVKDSTYDRYENTFIYHIKDTIGNKQMGSITTKDIQDYINEKAKPKDIKCKPLSYSSIKKMMELINPCHEHALEIGDMNNNPAKGVKMPHKDKFVVKTKEMYVLTDKEMKAIKNVADIKRNNGEPYYRYAWIYIIMLNTGIRTGEMLGLTWDDVDFEKKILKISKAS